MKKGKELKTLLVVTIMAVVSWSCGGKYAEIGKETNKQAESIEHLGTRLEKASKQVGAVLDDFNVLMTEYQQSLDEYRKKYPELSETSELPKDLMQAAQRIRDAVEKYDKAITTLISKCEDARVKNGALRRGEHIETSDEGEVSDFIYQLF